MFTKNWFRKGVVRARYDEQTLIAHLKRVFGKDLLLGDDSLQTGLLIVTKRLDTGSVWPLGNNPLGQFFRAKGSHTWISNSEFPLWKVVRASTAAPSFFDPEPIQISAQAGKKRVVGTFVDGGVSPYNNPSLQALMYAKLDGYKVKWPTGADKLLMVSVGTGASAANQLWLLSQDDAGVGGGCDCSWERDDQGRGDEISAWILSRVQREERYRRLRRVSEEL